MKFSKTLVAFFALFALVSQTVAAGGPGPSRRPPTPRPGYPPYYYYRPDIAYGGYNRYPVRYVKPDVTANAGGHVAANYYGPGSASVDNRNRAYTNNYYARGYGDSEQEAHVRGGSVQAYMDHYTNANMDHDYYPLQHEASERGEGSLGADGYYYGSSGDMWSDGRSEVGPNSATSSNHMRGRVSSSRRGYIDTKAEATAKSEN